MINYEPKLALDGGLEGLSVIRKVIKKSSELIKIGGKLILEIGYDQKEPVKKMLINNNKNLHDHEKLISRPYHDHQNGGFKVS